MQFKIIHKVIGISLFIQFVINPYFMTVNAQINEIDDELLIYILPDSLDFPKNETEILDLKKIKITSKSLDKALKKVELKLIKKAFPNFSEADTSVINDDGEKVKLPNMSRIFILKLKKKNDIQEVIEVLSKERSVLFIENRWMRNL
ncbi:MAG: hypothetical protein IPH62_12140 [Ignavibacteriae bacterium]|nr:hypothetical protein [Ignavibacteriota bacterium]